MGGIGCTGGAGKGLHCCQLFGNAKSDPANAKSVRSKRDYCRFKSNIHKKKFKFDEGKNECVEGEPEPFNETCFSTEYQKFDSCDGVKIQYKVEGDTSSPGAKKNGDK